MLITFNFVFTVNPNVTPILLASQRHWTHVSVGILPKMGEHTRRQSLSLAQLTGQGLIYS